MNVFSVIKQAVQEHSSVSSKRVALFSCVFSLIIIAFINILFQKNIDHTIIYSLEAIIIFCLGGMAYDRRQDTLKKELKTKQEKNNDR